jgi:hypothetical protein
MIRPNLIRPSKGAVVTSATRGVSRPPSRGLFLIRDEERVLRDVRVEVGFIRAIYSSCKAGRCVISF